MEHRDKLNILYRKILENGDRVLYYDRLMDNFYFKYDISREYAIEDLENMSMELDKWSVKFKAYQSILWEMMDEMESKISAVRHYARCKSNRKRCGINAKPQQISNGK